MTFLMVSGNRRRSTCLMRSCSVASVSSGSTGTASWARIVPSSTSSVMVCTVHVATMEFDDGPILAQEAVPVLPDDTEATLHERIKVVERRLLPDTIRTILERGSVPT